MKDGLSHWLVLCSPLSPFNGATMCTGVQRCLCKLLIRWIPYSGRRPWPSFAARCVSKPTTEFRLASLNGQYPASARIPVDLRLKAAAPDATIVASRPSPSAVGDADSTRAGRPRQGITTGFALCTASHAQTNRRTPDRRRLPVSHQASSPDTAPKGAPRRIMSQPSALPVKARRAAPSNLRSAIGWDLTPEGSGSSTRHLSTEQPRRS